jgi:hypothetical protein
MAKWISAFILVLSVGCTPKADSQDGDGPSSPTGLSSTAEQSGTGYTVDSSAGHEIDEQNKDKEQKKSK